MSAEGPSERRREHERRRRRVTRVRVVVDPDPYWPLRGLLVRRYLDGRVEPPLLPPVDDVRAIVEAVAARVDGFVGFVSSPDRFDTALVELTAEVGESVAWPRQQQLVDLLIGDPVKPTVTLVKGVRSLCHDALAATLEPYKADLEATWEQLVATFDQTYVRAVADFVDQHDRAPEPEDLDVATGGAVGTHLHRVGVQLCPPGWRVADRSPTVHLPQLGIYPRTWSGLLVRCAGSARVVTDAVLAGVGLRGLQDLAFAHPDVEAVVQAAHGGPDAVAELHAAITE